MCAWKCVLLSFHCSIFLIPFGFCFQFYGKAFAKDGTNMSVLTNMAAVFFEQEKYVECIAKCEEAVDVGRENRADFKLIAKACRRRIRGS